MFLVLLVCGQTVNAVQFEESAGGQPALVEADQKVFITTEVDRFLIEVLKIPDLSQYNLTWKMKRGLIRGLRYQDAVAFDSDGTPSWAARKILLERFSEDSAESIRKFVDALQKEQYNNTLLLGQPGVGKTFTVEQLIALLSFGIEPEFLGLNLKPGELKKDSVPASQLDAFGAAFSRRTKFYKVDRTLLSMSCVNNAKGEPWPKAEALEQRVLQGLLTAAQKDFEMTGTRTVFVFEEIGTMPIYLVNSIKSAMDQTGFVASRSPLKAGSEVGYSMLALTTPYEWRNLRKQDLAIERRFTAIELKEPSEHRALEILKKKRDEWKAGSDVRLLISDEILEFVIAMRRFSPKPSLAMPDSVIQSANELFNWASRNSALLDRGEISYDDVWEFLIEKAQLPKDVWLPKNGKPPLFDLADRLVAAGIRGHRDVIEKMALRIRAAALRGFAETPVFFLGGPTGSGKDTIARAVNQVLFGHAGEDLNFDLNDETFEDVLLRSNGDGLPRLVENLEKNHIHGAIVLNEMKNLRKRKIEQLKPLLEKGEIHPQGGDGIVRRLGINILFCAGEWGQERFQGLNEHQIHESYAKLTQDDVVDIFTQGFDGDRGALPLSVIHRGQRNGGLFILRPLAKAEYDGVVVNHVNRIKRDLKRRNGIEMVVDESLRAMVVEASEVLNTGTRGLEGLTEDFTVSAILKANELGLPYRGVSVLVTEGEKEGSIEVHDLTPGAAGGKYIVRVNDVFRGQCALVLQPKRKPKEN